MTIEKRKAISSVWSKLYKSAGDYICESVITVEGHFSIQTMRTIFNQKLILIKKNLSLGIYYL